MGVFWGKIGEGVVGYWPPTNSFFLLGVLASVPILVKIDQEIRPWECSQTDRYTDRQTQTDFIICHMLYAIALGQIINNIISICQFIRDAAMELEIYFGFVFFSDNTRLAVSKCMSTPNFDKIAQYAAVINTSHLRKLISAIFELYFMFRFDLFIVKSIRILHWRTKF